MTPSSPATPPVSRTVRIGGHEVDLDRRALLDATGQPIELRPQALELLCLLAEHAGEVVDKRSAIERVWPGMVVTDDSLVQAIGDIRRALGDDKHQVVQTVPRRGYRLIAVPGPAATAGSAAAPAPVPRSRRRVGWIGAASAVLLVVGVAAAVAWRSGTGSPVERLGQPALAVLAFRVESAQPADSLLGQSVAEEMIGDLARNIDVPVVSGRSSFQPDLQKLAAPQVAQRLKVRFLLDGSVRRDGEQLAIHAQLIDGNDGRVVWTHDARAGVADWAAARAGLVDRMASSARTSLWRHEKQRALAARAPASLDAYTLATRAYANKHLFNGPAYRDGRAAAEQAIKLDPNYAFAWAALGYLNSIDSGNNITGEWPSSRRGEALGQIDRALQLDAELSLAPPRCA
jgi:DNA-binding winged helix-turn-helix (wHTH) protein/TolB-like protein